jgi:DNA (cytosine-5)-methyltransferase 1
MGQRVELGPFTYSFPFIIWVGSCLEPVRGRFLVCPPPPVALQQSRSTRYWGFRDHGAKMLYSAQQCGVGERLERDRMKQLRGKTANVTALFAGIGGLELGLGATGHYTSLLCEIDPQASAVLRSRFRGVNWVSDVRATDELVCEMDDRSDLLTAGFPCTDFSQAGLTKGFAGDKSSLILDVLRLLKRRPFESILIENVPNWRVLHGGAYLRHVLNALEHMGYRWAYRTIDALAFGVPQRRLRVFLFATQAGDPREVLFHGSFFPREKIYPLREAAHGFYWTEGNRGLGWGEDCVPTLKGGSAIGIPSPPAVLLTDGRLITPDIRDAERLQGFEATWTDSPEGEEDDGNRRGKERRRWLLVGNAVNVHVSRWIGQQLVSRVPWDGPDGDPLDPTGPLPAAAWFDGSKRRSAAVSTWPVDCARHPLERFLSFEPKPLSYRATLGFYNRATKSTLRFSDGFLDAIRCHVEKMGRGYPPSDSTRSQHFFAFDSAVA